ncbi:MAG: hypothetical protein F6J93_37410 [Oscillatoria sp. SIO1A7]|nr:hypothetical protein [Oscillatoria sp. SIO1A7]
MSPTPYTSGCGVWGVGCRETSCYFTDCFREPESSAVKRSRVSITNDPSVLIKTSKNPHKIIALPYTLHPRLEVGGRSPASFIYDRV